MRISMIGAGYVGLVSGACLADFGHEVTCVDNDHGKVALLNRGETPIYEPQLGQVIAANVTGRAAEIYDGSENRLPRMRMRFSLRSERLPVAATATPIFPTFMRRHARSRAC